MVSCNRSVQHRKDGNMPKKEQIFSREKTADGKHAMLKRFPQMVQKGMALSM